MYQNFFSEIIEPFQKRLVSKVYWGVLYIWVCYFFASIRNRC